MASTLEANVDKSEVISWIESIGKDQSCASPLLQKIQEKFGYLPRTAMDIIVENSDISARQLYGVATFYSQFRLKPVGRHTIKICHGTACHVRGADRINTSINHILQIDEGKDTSPTGGYTLEDVACVGCCSMAPVMVINDQVFGDISGTDSERALKKHARDNDEKFEVN